MKAGRGLAVVTLIAVGLAAPVAGIPLTPNLGDPVWGAGVLRQGEVDDWYGVPWLPYNLCLPAFTRTMIGLVATSWVPGDQLTLAIWDGWGFSRYPTHGVPPMVAVETWKGSTGCPPDGALVIGTRVAAAATYTLWSCEGTAEDCEVACLALDPAVCRDHVRARP